MVVCPWLVRGKRAATGAAAPSRAVELGAPSGGFSVIVVVGASVDVTGTVVSMVSPAVVVVIVVCAAVVVDSAMVVDLAVVVAAVVCAVVVVDSAAVELRVP